MTVSAPFDLPLRSLQEWFLGVITHRGTTERALEGAGAIIAPDAIDVVVRPGASETPLERIAIYHRSYHSRLIECLADDYPALKYGLGDEAFDELCRDYIASTPPSEPNLNGYGCRLSDFVAEHRADLGRFASELARLEWALVEVLHARTPEALAASAFDTIPPELLAEVRFVTSPAVRVLPFGYPVNAFLQAFYEERKPASPARKPSSVLVVRQGYKIWRLDLQAASSTLLNRLVTGETLGAALNGIEARPGEILTWFREWTERGVFERVVLDEAGAGDP